MYGDEKTKRKFGKRQGQKGERGVGALGAILKSKVISLNAKILVYINVIRPTVSYVCESWTTNRNDEGRLEI